MEAGPGDGDDQQGLGESATGMAVAVGVVAAGVVFFALDLVLVNAEGPFGSHPGVGLLVALALTVVVAAAVALTALAVARHSVRGLVALLAGLAAVVVVAFPTRIDRHESFVPQPNERSSCVGLTFRYYPPDTFDASSDDYCVGLERPLPVG